MFFSAMGGMEGKVHAGNERANLTHSPQSRASDQVPAISFTTSLHFALVGAFVMRIISIC